MPDQSVAVLVVSLGRSISEVVATHGLSVEVPMLDPLVDPLVGVHTVLVDPSTIGVTKSLWRDHSMDLFARICSNTKLETALSRSAPTFNLAYGDSGVGECRVVRRDNVYDLQFTSLPGSYKSTSDTSVDSTELREDYQEVILKLFEEAEATMDGLALEEVEKRRLTLMGLLRATSD